MKYSRRIKGLAVNVPAVNGRSSELSANRSATEKTNFSPAVRLAFRHSDLPFTAGTFTASNLIHLCCLFCAVPALLCPMPAQARPLLMALGRPVSIDAILSLPAPLPPPSMPTSSLLRLDGPLWIGQTPDPSLQLTDWSHVFTIAALGAFDVPLRDDPGERTNILLSAQAVDNVTVAPGAEFSFNTVVGERTPERGFQDGLMFDNGRVVRGTGGGICLVATGLYNAALQAGLEITERHPHSGVVSYAKPGCDAGIAYGAEDFKFRNTTESPIVIAARAEADHVAVRLFGQTPPPGQQVIVKPLSLTTIPAPIVSTPDPTLLPGQAVIVQKPRDGYAVVLGRLWTQNGQVVRHEIVADEHRAPRPKIVHIGPASMIDPDVLPYPRLELFEEIPNAEAITRT